MAMTGAGMKSAIVGALIAEFGADYDNIADDHTLGGYDQNTYWNRYWGAVGGAIVSYIQGNANATGTDTPTGDSHNLSIT